MLFVAELWRGRNYDRRNKDREKEYRRSRWKSKKRQKESERKGTYLLGDLKWELPLLSHSCKPYVFSFSWEHCALFPRQDSVKKRGGRSSYCNFIFSRQRKDQPKPKQVAPKSWMQRSRLLNVYEYRCNHAPRRQALGNANVRLLFRDQFWVNT